MPVGISASEGNPFEDRGRKPRAGTGIQEVCATCGKLNTNPGGLPTFWGGGSLPPGTHCDDCADRLKPRRSALKAREEAQ